MSANQSDRRLLIDQLAWQEAMGIDEVLLDDATDDTTVILSAPAGAKRSATAMQVESEHTCELRTARAPLRAYLVIVLC